MNRMQYLTKSRRQKRSLMMRWAVLTLISAPVGAAHAGSDFNGDGHDDLAMSAPREKVDIYPDAGAVHVIYGSDPNGLASPRAQFWTQDSPDVLSKAGTSHYFGWALATGNFNGDAFDDLAITALYDQPNPAQRNYGVVHVLYGSSDGLTAVGNQLITPDNIGVDDEILSSAGFGAVLKAGDFDGDGFDELAMGTPSATMSAGINQSGIVHVLSGSRQGLRRTTAQRWSQETPGVYSNAEGADNFGKALESGDFNNDGFSDLAIGTSESFGASIQAGSVHVLFGSSAGLTAARDRLWYQSAPGIAEDGETYDYFGFSLASGDFDHDGFDDLAIGAPYEDRVLPGSAIPVVDTGIVHVLYGSATGLSATGSQMFSQEGGLIASNPYIYERFGRALVAGDMDGDGFSDLAIAAPNDIVGTVITGAVHVLYGTAQGLRTTGAQYWHQGSPGVLGTPEANDGFGFALATGDFDGDGRQDLAIGAVGETLNGYSQAGGVNILYGSANGATSIGDQFWHQDASGIHSISGASEWFGFALGR